MRPVLFRLARGGVAAPFLNPPQRNFVAPPPVLPPLQRPLLFMLRGTRAWQLRRPPLPVTLRPAGVSGYFAATEGADTAMFTGASRWTDAGDPPTTIWTPAR